MQKSQVTQTANGNPPESEDGEEERNQRLARVLAAELETSNETALLSALKTHITRDRGRET